MSYRKYNRRKSKPIFSKRSSSRSVIKVLLTVLLLVALIAVGYLIAKPIFSFLESRPQNEPSDIQTLPPETVVTTTDTTTELTTQENVVTEPEPIVVTSESILFAKKTMAGDMSYEEYIQALISRALQEGKTGICVEIITNGGNVQFNTTNEIAINSNAISKTPIADLSAVCKAIKDAGLVPYARVSALSDNYACSSYRKLAYMFEDGSSRWLDNKANNGGKPWISPFVDESKEYIGSICAEIAEIGFEKLILGEVEFPPFRQKDLGYIGEIVKSADRYLALVNFSNALGEYFGNDYYIEVPAEDIIAGTAEILTDSKVLTTNKVFVKFNLDDIPETISRNDGTKVSFSGLEPAYKLIKVFDLVNEALDNKGLVLYPSITCSDATQLSFMQIAEDKFDVSEYVLDIRN